MCLRVNIQDCYLPKLSQKLNYSFNKQDFNIRAVIDMKRDDLFYREIREVACFRRNLQILISCIR